jgi:hypothetical protein
MDHCDGIEQTSLEIALWARELNDICCLDEDADAAPDQRFGTRGGYQPLDLDELAEAALERAIWANDLNDICYFGEETDQAPLHRDRIGRPASPAGDCGPANAHPRGHRAQRRTRRVSRRSRTVPAAQVGMAGARPA